MGILCTVLLLPCSPALGQTLEQVSVEGQPLGANANRLLEALEYLGFPLPSDTTKKISEAAKDRDSRRIQELLDEHVLFAVSLNPEVRVKVARGPGRAILQQNGYTPHLVKVFNQSTVTRELRIASPNSGAVYAGTSTQILRRQAQTHLADNENIRRATDRFLEVEMYRQQPMTTQLSGLEVEYAIALIYCSESGKREATIGFDVGEGTQDIGFRGEIPVLFDVQPARKVKLSILDFDGSPTTARLTFRDKLGHVFPSQLKRLAPDFFFQPHIYREDGETVELPPGKFTLVSNRGPEYLTQTASVSIPATGDANVDVQLERWVNPIDYGFYSGDHHIHGAGCSHYTNPTQGVTPMDMFAQVKGEGLNVGCVLTWGPCFEFQRNYFSPIADSVSEDNTILKYDLEISGFGSAALGHVCLLRLKDQTYPGSEGSKIKGWPTWTVPVMRWAKEQGGVTGYPHSALHVNPQAAAQHLLNEYSEGKPLSKETAAQALLPESFEEIDQNQDLKLSHSELFVAFKHVVEELPNYCIPEMNGVGAMEICVSTAEGVCDFISAMDTERISEWNTWYHLMNCGFPLKLSGETDFPCMSSRRVGQGRVYVQLGNAPLEFGAWCEGLKRGQSYVSDGFAHALEFSVQNIPQGTSDVLLDQPATVHVRAKVAFSPEQPNAVAHGGITPQAGRSVVGDTRLLHAPRNSGVQEGGPRLVEIVVNGKAVASQTVEADGEIHELEFNVPISESSWVALRQFPQLHTNPVNVLVGNKPIRSSAKSARWCEETIRRLWKNRAKVIAKHERPAAKEAYDRAIALYRKIAKESLN